MIAVNLRFTIGDLRGALDHVGSQALSRDDTGENVARQAHLLTERCSSIVNQKS